MAIAFASASASVRFIGGHERRTSERTTNDQRRRDRAAAKAPCGRNCPLRTTVTYALLGLFSLSLSLLHASRFSPPLFRPNRGYLRAIRPRANGLDTGKTNDCSEKQRTLGCFGYLRIQIQRASSTLLKFRLNLLKKRRKQIFLPTKGYQKQPTRRCIVTNFIGTSKKFYVEDTVKFARGLLSHDCHKTCFKCHYPLYPLL